MKKPINFLSNKSLLEQIWLSKLSYCDVIDHDAAVVVDVITDDLTTVDEPDQTIRLVTDIHIPDGAYTENGHLKDGLRFEPFILYRSEIVDGALRLREVARSHSRNGEFETDHGNLTPTLSRQMELLVTRYALKPSWRGYTYRDEMESYARTVLVKSGLKFNEARTQNPFAYFTQLVTNAFIRVNNEEARERSLRDDLLEAAGAPPSMTRQLANLPSISEGGEVRHILKADPERLAKVQAYRESLRRSRKGKS